MLALREPRFLRFEEDDQAKLNESAKTDGAMDPRAASPGFREGAAQHAGQQLAVPAAKKKTGRHAKKIREKRRAKAEAADGDQPPYEAPPDPAGLHMAPSGS